MGTRSTSKRWSRQLLLQRRTQRRRFLMANDVDMSFAKIALTNAGSDEVKAFARRMLTDHTQIIANARALASDQEVTRR